jgi:hypothetical protein
MLDDSEANLHEGGTISCQSFIDSNHFVYKNRALISKMNDANYIRSTIMALKSEDGNLTDDQAKEIA